MTKRVASVLVKIEYRNGESVNLEVSRTTESVVRRMFDNVTAFLPDEKPPSKESPSDQSEMNLVEDDQGEVETKPENYRKDYRSAQLMIQSLNEKLGLDMKANRSHQDLVDDIERIKQGDTEIPENGEGDGLPETVPELIEVAVNRGVDIGVLDPETGEGFEYLDNTLEHYYGSRDADDLKPWQVEALIEYFDTIKYTDQELAVSEDGGYFLPATYFHESPAESSELNVSKRE